MHRCPVLLAAPSSVEPGGTSHERSEWGSEAVRVELHDPATGIAPGQACVIYDGTRVVGSATISRTARVAVS